jgi:hypothetical protein
LQLDEGIPVYGRLKTLLINTTEGSESSGEDYFSPTKKQKLVSDNEAILGPSILCSTPENLSRPMLARAISNPTLDEEQWLTASIMNLILTRIAEKHKQVAFFSEQFTLLKINADDFEILEDIIGRNIGKLLSTVHQFVWLINNGNVHWCLARAIIKPGERQLQLFDPLGNLSRRKIPSNRQIPRNIINWLNITFPFTNGDTWQMHAIHAVTASHQQNSFDCGVACLLYAEKCGELQSKEQINDETTQEEITRYRRVIQSVVHEVTSSLSQDTQTHRRL